MQFIIFTTDEVLIPQGALKEQRRLPAEERANRWKLSFWQNSPWGATWRGLYSRFCGARCVRSG